MSALTTALYPLHQARAARFVEFAGYQMPIQYPLGLLQEHLHTRAAAGLFDVSHMGQIIVRGPNAAAALEQLAPIDILDLGLYQQRYGLLLAEDGGILDDFMCVRRVDDFLLIVNGATKHTDLAHIQNTIGQQCEIVPQFDRALLALQGPAAAEVIAQFAPDCLTLSFMTGKWTHIAGHSTFVTRSGYSGEDGFEISLAADDSLAVANALLSHPTVELIGLGARNSLRLEAALCLYGSDLTTDITPTMAALNWSISKARRASGSRPGGFLGATKVLAEMDGMPLSRRRVLLHSPQRIPIREPATLLNQAQQVVGKITSGLLSPSLNQAIAMAYVDPAHSAIGETLYAQVRSHSIPMSIVTGPFVPHRYVRLS